MITSTHTVYLFTKLVIMVEMNSRAPQYMAAVAVNLAALIQGMVIGWASPEIPHLQTDDSPVDDTPMSDEEISWLGSVTNLGSFVATPSYSYLANRCSRKRTGYLIGLPATFCWIIITHAKSKSVLYIMRFILGCVGAGYIILCPLYITEIAEDSVRGSLVTWMQIFFYFGVLLSYCAGSYLSYVSFGWFCACVSMVFLVVFSLIPESPVYLLSKKEESSAKKSLLWVRNNNPVLVEQEMKKIKSNLERTNLMYKPTFMDLLSTKGTRKAMLITLALMTNSTLCGSFVVMTFAVTIFKESDSSLPSNTAAILIASLQLIFMIPASLLVDKVGRRKLLIVSNVGLACSLIALGTFYYIENHKSYVSKSFGWIPILILCTYILSMDLGVSTIPFVVMNEVLMPHIRGLATSVNYCVYWGFAFMTTRFFIPLSVHIGTGGCYWIFASICVLEIIFTYFYLIETKNRNLESIFTELEGQNSNENATTDFSVRSDISSHV